MEIYLDSAGEPVVVFSNWNKKHLTLTFPSASLHLPEDKRKQMVSRTAANSRDKCRDRGGAVLDIKTS